LYSSPKKNPQQNNAGDVWIAVIAVIAVIAAIAAIAVIAGFSDVASGVSDDEAKSENAGI
jgi:hypothetical protein